VKSGAGCPIWIVAEDGVKIDIIREKNKDFL
jgi:hypothetical protein